MNNLRTVIAATAISSILTSLPVDAGERNFNVPSTERARENAQLLQQAGNALYELPSHAGLITNVWLFPAGDATTVFARYTLKSAANDPSSTEHLALLTVKGDRIVRLRDLTDARTVNTLSRDRAPAGPHWSAAIANGHTSSTNVLSGSEGRPASVHWTAGIGTGRTTSPTIAAETKVNPSGTGQSVGDTHWTAKIGTGHASELESEASPSNRPILTQGR